MTLSSLLYRDVNETLRAKTETFGFWSKTEIETETFKTETEMFFETCLKADVYQFSSRICTLTIEQMSQKFLTLSEIHLSQFSTIK